MRHPYKRSCFHLCRRTAPHAGRRGAVVAAGVPDLDDLLGSLDVPDIEADLASYQTEAGASFSVSTVAEEGGGRPWGLMPRLRREEVGASACIPAACHRPAERLPPPRSPPPPQADGVAVTFNNDDAALEALQRGVALADRSHWGRLRLSGEGRAAFLHGQSTADILALRPGQGCDTVGGAMPRWSQPLLPFRCLSNFKAAFWLLVMTVP